jgi:hypothetical protein
MERDAYSSAPDAVSITLDLGGLDLSANDGAKNYRTLQVNFRIQPVENGIPKTDLGPESAYCTKSFYILKEEPGTPDAWVSLETIKYNKTIDADYQPVNGGTAPRGSYRHMSGGFFRDRNLTVLSYDRSQLGDQRIRYTHKNIYSWNIQNARSDAEARKLVIKSSRVDVSSYTRPSEYRIMLVGLSGEDAAALQQRLEGTKVYGVKQDGSKVLLSGNAPIMAFARYEESFDASGWEDIGGDEDYQYILFEYPDGGLMLTGQAEIDRFKTAIWTDVVAEIKESTYDLLKEKLDSGQSPSVSSSDFAYTAMDSEFLEKEGTEPVRRSQSIYDYTLDFFWMQYEDIQASNYINVTNGSYFFTDDTVTTHLAYNHGRYGNFSDATEPENLHIYYLVPDGLEPVEDPEMFSSLQVYRGYRDGYNLVSVRPKTISKPALEEGSASVTRTAQNAFTLSFTATNRLQIGRYTIYACASLDNNKLRVEKGKQYGILQHQTPSGLWSTILEDAENHPADQKKFTDFHTAAFTIYPPKVLNSVKQVKLASEPDAKYASSLGKRAVVGDAIDYRWVFKNNSPRAIDELTVIDVLPYRGDTAIIANDAGQHPSRGSCFSTPLISVDQNEKFDLYFSTDPVRETVEENEQARWQKSVPDMSAVTMIKAVLKEGQQILTDETCVVVTHNRIEENYKIQDGEKAYNSFAITLNEGNSYVEALKTEVQVTYPQKDVRIEKTDRNDPTIKLEHAVFSLYEEGTGENGEDLLVLDDLTTDQQGIAVMPDLPVGKNFYLLEKSAPDGYAREEGKIYFTVEDKGEEQADVQTVSVSNDIPRTAFDIVKKWIGEPAAESLSIHILADGEDTGSMVTLTAKDGWTAHVSGLPLYGPDGKEILYTVEEEENDAYTAEITGDAEQGFLITNTVKAPEEEEPEEPEKTETPETPQPPEQPSVQPSVRPPEQKPSPAGKDAIHASATGDSFSPLFPVGLLILAGTVLGVELTAAGIKRKREKKD